MSILSLLTNEIQQSRDAMRTICLLSPSIYAQTTAHPHPQRMGDIGGAVLVGGSLCLRSGRKICEGNVGLIDFQGQKMLWMSMLTILRKLELGRREEKKLQGEIRTSY